MEQNRKPTDKSTHLWTLIFDKGGKNTQLRKDNLFNKWCWENWLAPCKRMKLEHFLTPYTKINSKYSNTRNYKTPRGKHKSLSNISHSRILYDPLPRVMEIKAKINSWDLVKLKSFCTTKELYTR